MSLKVWKCCKLNLLQWRIQPKYLFCLAFLVLEMYIALHGFRDYGAELGQPITPWLLALLPGDQNRYIVLLLAAIFLFSDAPFRNRQQQMVFLRTGKVVWIAGQLLYLVFLSLTFTLILWVLSWIFLLPEVDWSPGWGIALKTAAKYFDAFAVLPPVAVSQDIIRGCTGLEATLWTCGIQTLVCLLLGEIMVLCNLWCKRGVGVAVTVALVSLSFLIRSMSKFVGFFRYLSWVSPVTWIDRSMMGHTNQYLPSFGYGIWMSLGLCLLLGAVIVGTIHRCDLESEEA